MGLWNVFCEISAFNTHGRTFKNTVVLKKTFENQIAAGSGDHAPHVGARRRPGAAAARGVRERRRLAPRHGALRGRGALRPDRGAGALHRARRRLGHAHHRRGRAGEILAQSIGE